MVGYNQKELFHLDFKGLGMSRTRERDACVAGFFPGIDKMMMQRQPGHPHVPSRVRACSQCEVCAESFFLFVFYIVGFMIEISSIN
jgi:ribosomal protein S14